MLSHKVPNHLEQPDVLLFGLTSRQTLLIGVGLAMSYGTWLSVLDTLPDWWGVPVAILAALLVAVLFAVTAFVKIKDRGLEVWIVVVLFYLIEPKVYLWRPAIDHIHHEEFELLEEETKKEEKEQEGW